jgi:hypothetical protein
MSSRIENELTHCRDAASNSSRDGLDLDSPVVGEQSEATSSGGIKPNSRLKSQSPAHGSQ